MGDLTIPEIRTQYRTGECDLVHDFYVPCLSQSIKYSRAVGYFRSSIFSIVSPAIIDFARRGGSFRLVCSPELGKEDLEEITMHGNLEEVVNEKLEKDLEVLLLLAQFAHPTRILAWLLKQGCLEIRLAVNLAGSGIYHDKIGIFTDSANVHVSFIGSANETWNGWHYLGNHEYLEVFRSSDNPRDENRIETHLQYFDALWNNVVSGVRVMSIPEAARERLLKVAPSDPDNYAPFCTGESLVRLPMDHQIEALQNWNLSRRRGILKHATGSGKTFTAILAIHQHLIEGNPAIILVPSMLLLKQWKREIQSAIPAVAILEISGESGSQNKYHKLHAMTSNISGSQSRIVIATMQSACMDPFLHAVVGGDHLLLVADEVHQIGSPENSKCLSILAGSRLGLSATPERYGDPQGTIKIIEYFGEILRPIISLEDAIRIGRLVKYEYHPQIVELTVDEQHAWIGFSKRIEKEIAITNAGNVGPLKITERAKILLIQRSKIAKKSLGKVNLARLILSREYQAGQRWLVYCEDRDQLERVVSSLQTDGLSPIEYMSEMQGSKQSALESFEVFGGILVSVRCLDEGVDIPAITHALILASSQNPRQFIQRRGRVLRTAPGKNIAVIYDALVFPPTIHDGNQFGSLVRSEIRRSLEFCSSAINRSAEMLIKIEAKKRSLWDDSLENLEDKE